jgi:hypothetical protein
MRAWEIITETDNRQPEISLRHVHYLKQERNRVAASHARRLPIIRKMYANPGKEHERIELEKAYLELEQQKAELAATEAEAQAETSKAISGMAKSEMRRRKI